MNRYENKSIFKWLTISVAVLAATLMHEATASTAQGHLRQAETTSTREKHEKH
jgi:hypothetical protein